MKMPGLNGVAPNGEYRYGFNGMESDDEMYGQEGNSYTTEFRQLDTRIGRWLSVDPLEREFAYQSPFTSMDNNPIYYTDPSGLFGTRGEAKKYKKDNDIKGRVRKSDEGGYEIFNKKANFTIHNDKEYGISKSYIVSTNKNSETYNDPTDLTNLLSDFANVFISNGGVLNSKTIRKTSVEMKEKGWSVGGMGYELQWSYGASLIFGYTKYFGGGAFWLWDGKKGDPKKVWVASEGEDVGIGLDVGGDIEVAAQWVIGINRRGDFSEQGLNGKFTNIGAEFDPQIIAGLDVALGVEISEEWVMIYIGAGGSIGLRFSIGSIQGGEGETKVEVKERR